MLNVPKLANKAMSKVNCKVLAEKHGNSAKEFIASVESGKYPLKSLEPPCDTFKKSSKIDLSKISLAATEIKTVKKLPVWKRILGKILG